MKKATFAFFPLVLAISFSAASAYTLSGTVNDESGNPISGGSVKLLQKETSAITDAEGKFTIQEDGTQGLPSRSSTPQRTAASRRASTTTPPARVIMTSGQASR